MTTFEEPTPRETRTHKLTISEILELLSDGNIPMRFTAYDGSAAGPEDAEIGLTLKSPRGTTYLATAPGDLGMARAYVSGYSRRNSSSTASANRPSPPPNSTRAIRSPGSVIRLAAASMRAAMQAPMNAPTCALV